MSKKLWESRQFQNGVGFCVFEDNVLLQNMRSGRKERFPISAEQREELHETLFQAFGPRSEAREAKIVYDFLEAEGFCSQLAGFGKGAS